MRFARSVIFILAILASSSGWAPLAAAQHKPAVPWTR